ncbi:nucleotidyltransferase substrate binding protein (TIGR01987 family) [Scopulibacillus darangshiensis]|uniref:Nucleotidyltransferase substrate binding protein (TIGR01987 family) n=1 Tax=Scopulibacillus darangshiensis TaxID=442528 RepID=A0A4R2NU77_9BACL|nr:HI0074 family nucleotidyltransferase substrate-binding subunit [Scopulibacillus darangshiensis]TCP24935.1 nucleotidyltransferase substrate binding protein (TIGR01987 family) [Scopulibacillus darangshiensis]
MERLRERLKSALRALKSFEQLVAIEEPNDIERDAAIQRFEFTFEACWKAAKQYLYDVEGVDVGSPKGVIRRCRDVGLLDSGETTLALKMVNDRNLTVHTYNEEVARKIHTNLKDYFPLLAHWVQRMEKEL